MRENDKPEFLDEYNRISPYNEETLPFFIVNHQTGEKIHLSELNVKHASNGFIDDSTGILLFSALKEIMILREKVKKLEEGK